MNSEEIIKKIHTKYPMIPVPIKEIAKNYNIDITEVVDLKEKSGSIEKKGENYLIKINIFDSLQRQRFTTAHILGHYFMHKKDIENKKLTINRMYRSKLPLSKEVEANRFAANLLIPLEKISEIIDKKRAKTISELAEKFFVSRITIAIRLGIPIDK